MSDPRGAWRAALACMVTLAVAMGLGRFAFTPALPLMLHEGKLDLQGGGLLASLNYLGYFVGALSCAAIHVRAGHHGALSGWPPPQRCCLAWA